MNLLLDTHVFLWWREARDRIGSVAMDEIGRADQVFVSVASAWEIAIKIGLGRLRLPGPVDTAVEASGFEKLPISFRHAERVATLPHHHKDPFDRMLIAQAQVEGLAVVTHDERLGLYGVPIVRV